MWSHNDTHSWAKQTLTSEDETYIRQEARRIDASGDNKKQRANMNAALRSKQQQGRLNKKSPWQTGGNEVSDLDLQIDKLWEMGDKEVRAKSTLRNKGAKVKEILAGLERRRAPDIPVTEDVQMESEHTESVLPDDIELYHPDKVVF
ncbi:hypothetical protein B0J17DRAFT_634438 [Rhizoctonia solani]|nr:hypothetical protein B0J17DRAFT_634438 [Rhizoctonia solani]